MQYVTVETVFCTTESMQYAIVKIVPQNRSMNYIIMEIVNVMHLNRIMKYTIAEVESIGKVETR